MKTLRSLPFYAILISILALSACSSPTNSGQPSSSETTYSNKVLPGTFVVKLPTSLAGMSAAATATTSDVARIRSLRPLVDLTGSSSYSATSGGYRLMETMTSLMQSSVFMFDLYGILIDAVISQNSLGPGTYPSEKITITQGMYNAIAAQLPASEAPNPAIVGVSQTFSDLVYSTSANSGIFTNSVQFTISAIGLPLGFSWSSDRTKLKMSYSFQGETSIVTYDSATKSCACQVAAERTAFTLAIESDSNSTTGGVFVNASNGSPTSGSLYLGLFAESCG